MYTSNQLYIIWVLLLFAACNICDLNNIQGILREDQTIVDALTEYAPLIYHLGPAQSEEAMTVLLTLVANHRGMYTIQCKTWL